MPAFRFSIPLFLFCLLFQGCSQSPMAWWKNLNKKAGELASLETRHKVLEAKYEQLRAEHYKLEQELAELKAEVASKELASRNLEATGSLVGRHPASIDYKLPRGLKPEELLALAYEHFKEKRFAEAAVSFEEFLHMPEGSALQDAPVMYTAGVAWFQLGNFKKAREHLEAARTHAAGEEKGKIRKKVDLWMRVIDRKLASESQGG